MAVAEEGALERVGLAGARHLRDADIGGQLHELAAEVVAAVDISGESQPVVIVADDVGVVLRAGAGGVVRHVICAIDEEAVLVCRHHAVILHEAAEVGRGGSVGNGMRALCSAHYLGEVAGGICRTVIATYKGGAIGDGRPA